MRDQDWADRSSRWAGIDSRIVDVGGASCHVLVAEAGPEAAPDAPTQLLIHPMASGAAMWLDVIGPLTACGPVVAPDLPGAVLGRTAAPHWTAARAEPSARFLRALVDAECLGPVVTHGWSMGGLIALRLAHLAPHQIRGLVLVNPTLPGPLTGPERLGWQTMGRLGLASGPSLARGLVRVWGRRAVDTKLRRLTDPQQLTSRAVEVGGGDPSRLAPENVVLWTELLYELRSHPERMGNAVTAWASATSTMFVHRRPAMEAIARVDAPTLLLWGDQDPLITHPVIDYLIAHRPDWTLRVLETAGHLAPLELPRHYADVVGRWLESVST